MTVANAGMNICPLGLPSEKCTGVCSHSSMSSEQFNQFSGAHQSVNFNSVTAPGILILMVFRVVFNLSRKEKSGGRSFTHMSDDDPQCKIIFACSAH